MVIHLFIVVKKKGKFTARTEQVSLKVENIDLIL